MPLLVAENYYLYRKFYVVHIPTYREVVGYTIDDHLAHRGVECGQLYCPSNSTRKCSIDSYVHTRGVQLHCVDEVHVSYCHTWMYAVRFHVDHLCLDAKYSLGPRPKTNPSADRFQYRAGYTGSDIRAG